MGSIFEQMIEGFSQKDTGVFLDECMNTKLNVKQIRKIPVRYRIIAAGFVSHMNLEDLNQKLEDNGCERLYARNITEASLIYAFQNKKSYEEWRRLYELCEDMRAEVEDPWFNNGAIKLNELENYVQENSENKDGHLLTQHITQHLSQNIRKQSNDEAFLDFMKKNMEQFRPLRDKARYYYCKYLLFFINERVENYLNARKTRFDLEYATVGLNVLKCAAKLRKKFNNDQDIINVLKETSLSCGNIYEAFNEFYFGYSTSDWLDVLLDNSSWNLELLNLKEKAELANAIRSHENDWRELSDEEVIRKKQFEQAQREQEIDEEYRPTDYVSANGENSNHGYQKNRSGEKTVRGYIQGSLDLDRITLIFYLLFFANRFVQHKDLEMNRKRLDEILENCGFQRLSEDKEMDYFVIEYLEAENREEFLQLTVEAEAREKKNSYLYHIYRGAVSEDKVFESLLRNKK